MGAQTRCYVSVIVAAAIAAASANQIAPTEAAAAPMPVGRYLLAAETASHDLVTIGSKGGGKHILGTRSPQYGGGGTSWSVDGARVLWVADDASGRSQTRLQ